MAEHILMIEDDQSLARMVGEYLNSAGLNFCTCPTAAEGLALLRRSHCDALILDVMLPDKDGFEVCRTVRAESEIPILMLTARGDELDRIIGLELGADDYLPKPFNPRELLARLKAILRRRTSSGPKQALHFGRLVIDREAREVRLDGEAKLLTGYQFDLLWLLAEHAGRVLSRDYLLNQARGEPLEAFDRSIDVHISRIRAAIEADPKAPKRIITVRGVGYVFARHQDEY